MTTHQKPEETPERIAFYQKIKKHAYSPLWSVLSDIITPEPKSACAPYLWQFAQAKEYLLEAGNLITAKEAERRVLILENPGMPGSSQITTSLYAGLQLVMPGEVAPAHRHSQTAIRFVLDGEGAYTSVDGERVTMSFGDFIITPPQSWHDHGNATTEPMIWLDGLDIPMVTTFNASFAESFDEDEQPITRPTGDSLARYGANMLPVDFVRTNSVSPLFQYPYCRSREALELMRRAEEWDPYHGLKLQYINPANGESAMPTMSTFLQLLPGGFSTAPYRSTDATIFTATEGHGCSTIGNVNLEWGPKDVFVVPGWHTVQHEAESDAVLFSYSDRVAQQKLGLWREQRL